MHDSFALQSVGTLQRVSSTAPQKQVDSQVPVVAKRVSTLMQYSCSLQSDADIQSTTLNVSSVVLNVESAAVVVAVEEVNSKTAFVVVAVEMIEPVAVIALVYSSTSVVLRFEPVIVVEMVVVVGMIESVAVVAPGPSSTSVVSRFEAVVVVVTAEVDSVKSRAVFVVGAVETITPVAVVVVRYSSATCNGETLVTSMLPDNTCAIPSIALSAFTMSRERLSLMLDRRARTTLVDDVDGAVIVYVTFTEPLAKAMCTFSGRVFPDAAMVSLHASMKATSSVSLLLRMSKST